MSLSLKVATALLTRVDSALLGRKVELSLDWTPASLPCALPPRPPMTSQARTTSNGAPDGAAGGVAGAVRVRTSSGSWLMRRSLGFGPDAAQPGCRTVDAYRGPMRFVHLGFAPDLVDYEQGWQTQREVHAQVVDGTLPDTTLLLEHAAVYTAGKRTEPHERPTDGTPVIDVDRGGKITWHGPGQLVGYPIVRLTQVPIDVVAHVRRLEDVMIRVCRDFGVETVRVDGRSGVWVLADDRGPDRKLGAIGVRVSRRVTMHGFALNCDADLSWADAIIPCGIPMPGCRR